MLINKKLILKNKNKNQENFLLKNIKLQL